MDPQTLLRQSIEGMLQLLVAMGLCLFLPAWTLHYWQAWVFLAVFGLSTIAITLYLFKHDRALLERRLRAGPGAESTPSQKLIQGFAGVAFLALLVIPALDHRSGWSHLPPAAALVGDALVALGFWVIFRVFRVNTFTSGVVEVDSGQTVISTGPYALVRHPMYAGALLLFLGIPLSLGSAWGMLMFIPAVAALAWRLLDEESFLCRHLPGYEAYREQTRYRLVPFVW